MVAAFEDDAVEFVVCDGDGEVGFLAAAGGEAREEFGVEEGDPSGAGGLAPVKKGEEGASAVVYAWVLGVLATIACSSWLGEGLHLHRRPRRRHSSLSRLRGGPPGLRFGRSHHA